MHSKHWHLFVKNKAASNLLSWWGIVQGKVWVNSWLKFRFEAISTLVLSRLASQPHPAM